MILIKLYKLCEWNELDKLFLLKNLFPDHGHVTCSLWFHCIHRFRVTETNFKKFSS